MVSIFRVFFIMNQPPFLDEAIYVNLADKIANAPTLNNFLSPLNAGLSPLFIYFTAIAIVFFHNPFFSGRFVSLFVSFLTTAALLFFLRKIKTKNIYFPILFFYFNPFTWMYSQMALLETTMMFFVLLFLIQSENVVEKSNFINVLTLSILFMFIVLSKYTGFFIVFYFLGRCISQKKYKSAVLFIFLVFLFFLASFPVISKLFSTFLIHSGKKQLLQINVMRNNFHLIWLWIKDYFSLLMIILIIIYAFISRRIIQIKIAVFIILFMYFFFTLFATNFFPRYLYLTVPMICLILSFSKNKIFGFIILFLIFFNYLPTDWKIMFDLKNAPIAKEDVYQYATDWTSGKNIITIFKNSKKNQILCISPREYNYFLIVKDSFFKNKNVDLKINCIDQKIYTTKSITE